MSLIDVTRAIAEEVVAELATFDSVDRRLWRFKIDFNGLRINYGADAWLKCPLLIDRDNRVSGVLRAGNDEGFASDPLLLAQRDFFPRFALALRRCLEFNAFPFAYEVFSAGERAAMLIAKAKLAVPKIPPRDNAWTSELCRYAIDHLESQPLTRGRLLRQCFFAAIVAELAGGDSLPIQQVVENATSKAPRRRKRRCGAPRLDLRADDELLGLAELYDTMSGEPLDSENPCEFETPPRRLNWFLYHLPIDGAVAIATSL